MGLRWPEGQANTKCKQTEKERSMDHEKVRSRIDDLLTVSCINSLRIVSRFILGDDAQREQVYFTHRPVTVSSQM